MTTISDNERARALELYRLHFRLTNDYESITISPDQLGGNLANTWLAVEAHVLAAHECPSTDRRALGHYRHPRMDGQTECPECGYLMHEHGWLDCGGDGIVVCPSLYGPFGGQAVTDHARDHTCPTVPVWRPVTRDEIQAGWEVRARRSDGLEAGWGVAHDRDYSGDWRTEAGNLLTGDHCGWTYETTAPEPKPDPRIEVLAKELHEESGCEEPWPCSTATDHYRKRARKLLASFNALTEGEQS